MDNLNGKLVEAQKRIDGFMMQTNGQCAQIAGNRAGYAFQSKENENI